LQSPHLGAEESTNWKDFPAILLACQSKSSFKTGAERGKSPARVNVRGRESKGSIDSTFQSQMPACCLDPRTQQDTNRVCERLLGRKTHWRGFLAGAYWPAI